MLSISELITKISSDYPQYRYTPSDTFAWDPPSNTIYYNSSTSDVHALLHELAHALLGHRGYTRDIGLVEIERDAWEHAASTIAPRYNMTIPSDVIEDALDTYRDWLHARSLCPGCSASGVQVAHATYVCLACSARWDVNEAKQCSLRRYLAHTQCTMESNFQL